MPEQVTVNNFNEFVLENEKPVLLDFWAAWCGPCQKVGLVIDDLAHEYGDRIAFGKVNVDEEGELAAKFRVMSIPTLYLFRDGEILTKLVGARSREELAELLETVL